MNGVNKTNLTKLKLFKQTKQNYFYQEINHRKSCCKKLSKSAIAFDYIDKILIVLSATTGGVSIISFMGAVGVPACRNCKCKFWFNFFSNSRNNEKIIKHNNKQKEKAR